MRPRWGQGGTPCNILLIHGSMAPAWGLLHGLYYPLTCSASRFKCSMHVMGMLALSLAPLCSAASSWHANMHGPSKGMTCKALVLLAAYELGD